MRPRQSHRVEDPSVSDSERKRAADARTTGSQAEPVGGDAELRARVSTGGHMDPSGPGEMPDDARGAGTAERNRDRSAGLGEGLPHEGADVPDAETIGGRASSSWAGRQILDAIEEREPDRGSVDHSVPPRSAPPPRRKHE